MVQLLLRREQARGVLAERIRAGEELVEKERVAVKNAGQRDWISLYGAWRQHTITELEAVYEGSDVSIEFQEHTKSAERLNHVKDFPYKQAALYVALKKLRDLIARLDLAGEPEEVQPDLSITDPGPSPGGATWADLDSRVAGLSSELIGAASRDDIQDVGRRAREILIDCARLIADPALVPEGQPIPKSADAKAWLDLFLAARAGGSTREELRRLVRAAWELAQKVTHGGLGRVDAFAAAQATVLVVRTLQQLASGSNAPSG